MSSGKLIFLRVMYRKLIMIKAEKTQKKAKRGIQYFFSVQMTKAPYRVEGFLQKAPRDALQCS